MLLGGKASAATVSAADTSAAAAAKTKMCASSLISRAIKWCLFWLWGAMPPNPYQEKKLVILPTKKKFCLERSLGQIGL